jgi:hypothetical protein
MTSSDISLTGRTLSSRSNFLEICFMKTHGACVYVEYYEVHLVLYNKAYICALQWSGLLWIKREHVYYTCQIKLMKLHLIFSIILTRIPVLQPFAATARSKANTLVTFLHVSMCVYMFVHSYWLCYTMFLNMWVKEGFIALISQSRILWLFWRMWL